MVHVVGPSGDHRPRLLDLFCGAGGAARGYMDAGFLVIGVDIKPQPRYCGHAFHQADALEFVAEHGWRFDAIHASPPCQRYSDLQRRTGRTYPDLVPPTRAHLAAAARPYVIENVPEAPLQEPVVLCGSTFPNVRVIRHRAFETSFPVVPRPCIRPHPLVFTFDKRKRHYGTFKQEDGFVQVTGGGNCRAFVARAAMGIDWMTKAELNEAVPPAYTRYVGAHLMAHLRSR